MRNKDLEKYIAESMSASEMPSPTILEKTKRAMADAKPPKKPLRAKLKIALSCCIVVLVCLAIALPLALKYNSTNTPQNSYLKNDELSNSQYSSIKDFAEAQGVVLLSFTSITELVDMGGTLVETSRYTQEGCEIFFVGRDIAIIKEEVRYDLGDDYDDIIANIVMPKYVNTRFEQFEPYDNLDSTLTMEGIVIECEYIEDEKIGRACFNMGSYKYYVQISTETAQTFTAHFEKLSNYLKTKYI